MKSINPSVK